MRVVCRARSTAFPGVHTYFGRDATAGEPIHWRSPPSDAERLSQFLSAVFDTRAFDGRLSHVDDVMYYIDPAS